MKRAHDGDEENEPPAKVQRLLHPDRLSRLSEELLVRVLSFIPVPSLLVCQRLVRSSEGSIEPELTVAQGIETVQPPVFGF